MLISFPNHPFTLLTVRNPNCRDKACFFPQISKVGSRSQSAAARKCPSIRGALITNPDEFEVGRFVGSYGFMNITSYSSFQAGGLSSATTYDLGYSSEDIERLRVQDVGEGQVKIRLYEGRVVRGPLKGTRIIFKDDEDAEDQQLFRKVKRTIRRMNLLASSRV